MDRQEFLKRMDELKVHPKFYSIDGIAKEYAFNLQELSKNKFAVFYLEKGEKIDENTFDNKNSAYEFLFREINEEIECGIDLSK